MGKRNTLVLLGCAMEVVKSNILVLFDCTTEIVSQENLGIFKHLLWLRKLTFIIETFKNYKIC